MEATTISEPVVVLSYRRSTGELSTGAITYWLTEHEADVLRRFEDAPYKDMLVLFAMGLRDHPEARAAIHRTDRGGLAPMLLSVEESNLFRTDPAAAIQARTISPQVVHIGVEKPKAVIPPEALENIVLPLVVGYDTRADCFGELVFVKVRTVSGDPFVECPFCGCWAARDHNPDKAGGNCHTFLCRNCEGLSLVPDLQEKWAGVDVSHLLSVGPAFGRGYFLPRAWNKNGNWISREELQQMYSRYLEEKEKIR